MLPLGFTVVLCTIFSKAKLNSKVEHELPYLNPLIVLKLSDSVLPIWTSCITFVSVIFTRLPIFVGMPDWQWQTTPKNLPRMQRTRAIPVTWLSSGLCPDRPKGWIPVIIIIIMPDYLHCLGCTKGSVQTQGNCARLITWQFFRVRSC